MIPRRRIYISSGDCAVAIKALFGRQSEFSRLCGEWEEAFAHAAGAAQGVSVGSGREGMRLILRSLGLQEGDEVVIPAYTLKALIGVIESLGLAAVPADIDPRSFNIDPDSIRQRITPRTKVIMATHIFGTPCAIDRILDIARARSIYVVEDCAHAAGSGFRGRPVGSFGDAAFFSFETIKPINTYGGGMVVTNNGELAARIRQAYAGASPRATFPFKKACAALLERILLPTPFSLPLLYVLSSPRWSSRAYALYRKAQSAREGRGGFSGYQASMGLEKLKSLQSRIAQKKRLAGFYRSLFGPLIQPQYVDAVAAPNYYFFVVLLPWDAGEARRFLLSRGIDAGVGAEIADECGGPRDCPRAHDVFRRALQLPLYEGMDFARIRFIAETLEGFVRRKSTGARH